MHTVLSAAVPRVTEETVVFRAPGCPESAPKRYGSIGYKKLPEPHGAKTGYERVIYCVTQKWQNWLLLEWAWIALRKDEGR